MGLLAEGASDEIQRLKSCINELAAREARIRRLVDANIIGIIIWNLEGRIVEANEAFLRVVGYNREELVSGCVRWTDMTPPEWRARDSEALASLKKIGTVQPYEKEYFRKDGSRVAVLLGGACFGDNSNQGVAFVMDITKRKVAEQALQQSKDHLRQVIDTIPVQIWSGPADGNIDFVNARWRSELGVTLDEIQGDGWQKMLHPDERPQVVKAWNESVATGKPYEHEERHRMFDGQYRWFLARAVPQRDEYGKIIRWFGSNTEIDDQKQAEEALRKSEERWQAVFENSAIGVALTDQRGCFLATNSAYQKMLGYTGEELSRLTFSELTKEDYRELNWQLVTELFEGKRRQFQIEKQYRRKDGSLIWVSNNVSLVPGTESMPRFLMALSEDITERKHLSDQLQQERDRLRVLLDLGQRFVSNLDVRAFFDGLVDGVRRLGPWDWVTILLPQAGSNLLTVHLSPPNAYLREGDTVPIDGTLQGRVYRSGNPTWFRAEDLPTLCDLYCKSPWMQEVLRDSGMMVGYVLPLSHEAETIGVLFLMSREAREPSEGELKILQAFSGVAATALFNILRFEHANESHARLISERDYIEAEFLRERGIDGIIGGSPGITEVVRQVNVVAPTDSTVLISGETGTGKELVARAIHERSPRRDASFVKIDCAAIPAALMESELFGHEKGAFTGATARKLGRFEVADKGTIFLDEVGDIPLELQPKLLRVLQDRAFERVGSNRLIKVDVRITAATHKNLEEMVEKGTFREDLFYRLRVFPIVVPPLRERAADIPVLVKHYVETYARRMNKEIPTVTPAAIEAFLRYPWPGNVRELQHFIERSVVLTQGRQLQAPLSELRRFTERHTHQRATQVRTLEETERDSILAALEQSNWVVGGPNGAAAKLGLKRTTLASRMEKLGISRVRRYVRQPSDAFP